MASREDNPIWLDAKEIISALFHDQNKDDWLKLEQRKVIQTPSSAGTKDFIITDCCEVRAQLQEGFEHIFEDSHVNTFWEDLVFKLKRAGGIHPFATRKRQNEDQLVASMILPTLKKVVDSISIIPVKRTNGQQPVSAVSSHVIIQDEIETGNASGKSPAVDATIQISDGKNFYVLIPVELKVEIKKQHQYQIAAYVTKMSTAKELENKVMIGILMDKDFFKLIFSPYKSNAKAVPLPIVYVSPLIRWKESSPQTLLSVIPAALLVIACTCYYQRDRIDYVEEKIPVDSQILQIAEELSKNRHIIKPILIPDDVSVTNDALLQIVQKQQKAIVNLETKIEDLQKQLHIKHNGVLTDSQGSNTSSTTT